MIFFTSDAHYSHANIIRFCNRPFADVHSMNKHITESWNKVVTPEDEVYILGDIFFKLPKSKMRNIMSGLNGKKYIVKGNHDRTETLNNLFNAKLIEWWKYSHDMSYEYDGKMYDFSLSHYPHYPVKGDEIICLHGHTHGIYEHHGGYTHATGVIDVGVDNLGYEPISIEQIINFIERSKNG